MQKKKVMIVDDEPGFIDMIKMRLDANGYETITARDGKEAFDKMPQAPDLILLDIMMPGMDGYTFLREMRSKSETKSIPVIVVTGRPDMEDLFQMEGILDYIVKSDDITNLMAVIRKTLDVEDAA